MSRAFKKHEDETLEVHHTLNFVIMTIPTAVEHAVALLRILYANGLVCTFNGNVERRNLLKINEIFSAHLMREKS